MYPAVKRILVASLVLASLPTWAIDITTLRVTSPYTMESPLKTDTADVKFKAFDDERLLMDSQIPLNAWKQGELVNDGVLLADSAQNSIRLAGFTVESRLFAKSEIKVEGAHGQTAVYVDGKQGASTNLLPGRHTVVIRILQKAGQNDTLKVTLDSKQEQYLTINPEGKRLYSLDDYIHGPHAGKTDLSPSGRYMILSSSMTSVGGKREDYRSLIDLKTGAELPMNGFYQWASTGDRYIKTRSDKDGCRVYEYVDVATGKVTSLFTDYNNVGGSFLPGEKLMLLNKRTEGPKEDPKVHQVLAPDDRMAGYRNRNNVQLMEIESGHVKTLTQGQHDVYATPSDDGQQILLFIRENCITERPFSFTTVLLLDRQTMQTDTLIRRDGFVGSAQWAPDGKSLVFSGSPESFGGIGKNDPTGKIPSMIQTELYQMDLQTKEVKPLTFDFNPNVDNWEWNRADGNIYALCENHDCKEIFRLDMKTKKWSKLNLSEQYIYNFSLANDKPFLSYVGESDSNSERVYVVDLKTGKETLLRDVNEERMSDIQLGKCDDWNFQSSRGDTIYGRYYLPPYFDETKKYPMLVYYYGGCSPVGRYLDSYYNYHGWAAMGYVVYVIQPSGCTGFGQEFAARHVNAYGEYTANDIIEGTKKFCQEHPYVNDKKIGCLGASYGGFMTMYLQTVTDIFAAAMAHAGISNPASYWGFGNWGYSYNATAAAHSYPWNNPELMSLRSPLFNADKVKTPILFLHGSIDDNVPIIESTQMFNALKILGKECAFVTVDGQSHHILDYEKRIKWVNTFYAWFAKYLQDDPTWWEEMYPTKNLK